MLFNINFVVGN